MITDQVCVIDEYLHKYKFTMTNGETFQARGVSSFDAFCSKKSKHEWEKMSDWEQIDELPSNQKIKENVRQQDDSFDEEFIIIKK